MTDASSPSEPLRLRRALGLWDLILYGLIVVQPTAPMPVYGVISDRAHGHVVTAILLAMAAMLFTAISYGKMARIYPSAGSAFNYVGRELHPVLGYITGWCMTMDYILNPILCTILCSKFAMNFVPVVPYAAWVVFFVLLFTGLNLQGIQSSARINTLLAAGMGIVIAVFLMQAAMYIFHLPFSGVGFFFRPFYDAPRFSLPAVLGGTSLAVLTYIGFDGVSTLSEEARDARRDIPRATILVCLFTGVLAAVQVYAAQLVWPTSLPFPDPDTAFVSVAGRAGGHWLYLLINATLLVATIGSGFGSQLGAARILYGMGRSGAIPKKFFGAIEPKRLIPRNNILLVGVLALIGAFMLNFERAVELLNFGALLAFIGVNIAAFVRYFVRAKKKAALELLIPLAGATVCLLLWLNLTLTARIFGLVWMLAGIAFGAWTTRGFKGKLIQFED
jgi:amino acid transporter